MRFLKIICIAWLCLLPAQALAQGEDDAPGYLAGLIQDALSGAGREVRIIGFTGALSAQARMERMTIADDSGVWLTLSDVTLDWTRSALLRGRIEVNQLSAARLEITRVPESEPEPPKPQATPFTLPSLPDLPVAVNIGAFEIAEIALGAPVLGQPLAVRVSGSAALVGGAGTAELTAERVDDVAGRFGVSMDLAAEGANLQLAIDVEEEAGGLLATSIGVPGAPSVDFSIAGAGPLSDFAADIALATDGQDRLSGRVELRAEGEADALSRVVMVDIGGDLAPLFAPDYAEFFGDSVALQATATQVPSGAVDLSALRFDTRHARLAGTARIDPNGWPEALNFEGRIADPSGAPVLLPLAGAPSRVERLDLSVQFDAASGDALLGRIDIASFTRPDVQLAEASVTMDGTLSASPEGIGALKAGLTLAAREITGLPPEIGAALGPAFEARGDITYATGAPFGVENLRISAQAARLEGALSLDTSGSEPRVTADLGLQAEDLSRFAGLAGQEIGGRGRVNLAGDLSPLSGAFDLDISAVTENLAIGIAQADPLLAGETRLALSARRDESGVRVEGLSLANPELSLEASGALGSDSAALDYAARVRDVSLAFPGVTGALTSSGAVRMDGGDWQVDVTAAGPFGASVDVAGAVAGADTAIDLSASLPDVGVFVPELSGPLSINAEITRPLEDWALSATAQGVSGLEAQVNGNVTPGGIPDLSIVGTAPLALAQPFIAPRAIQGVARFDLGLRGGFGPEALTGQVSTRAARITAPTLRLVLENLDTDIALSDGTANVTLTGINTGGGRFSLEGALGFTGLQRADVGVTLTDFTLSDPKLYKTRIDGRLRLAGALSALGISGDLLLGETNIIVPSTGLTSFATIPEITHIGASGGVQATRRRAGFVADEAAAGTSGPPIALNIAISAPGRIFVRGRGLDAELGGQLEITGTASSPVSAGAFELVRGHFDILGERYELEEGLIQLQGSLEPFLRFVAATRTSTGTARVIVEGDASEPEVSFVSEPEAPEEEVLAQLLFDRGLSEMSALQAVQLASAVATLAGRGGAGIVGNLREGLGVDTLDINTTAEGETEVNIGKYISDNAYTDVTVDSLGNSEVSLNIDLTPNFTAKGSVGADGNSGIGLFFERDY